MTTPNPSTVREPEESVVWIRTDMPPGASGYIVTLEADDDTARVLDPAEALAHAGGVLAAVARAEYDAAVARQLTAEKMAIPLNDALHIVSDLRADRPPLDPKATHPITFDPGVNEKLKPFLVVSINGQRVGQWDMEDARHHAIGVLEAVAVADLDSAYYRMLISSMGLQKDTASLVIDDLGSFR